MVLAMKPTLVAKNEICMAFESKFKSQALIVFNSSERQILDIYTMINHQNKQKLIEALDY